MTSNQLSSDRLREAFGTFPSGVVAVCGMGPAGERIGMAVSTFIPVSLEPALVAVCLQNSSRTWPLLRTLPVLGVSVLAAAQNDVARQLAAKDGDRFLDLPTTACVAGGVHIDGAPTYFECSLESEMIAGDHLIATLRVRAVTLVSSAEPLLFHRSRFTILGQPQTIGDPR